ncbi:hypothetical protein C6P40_002214 [Pichia californica]|uniref:2-dehydropantoate 2-reductase n=1 Tax=Pichia californica TaxID=460514 RepID=A0A9P6WI40_9ASCO|nr:hypothetical protein C6P42_000776 [[Candida] californica]KAG0687535.1 hypothetical protein C6P40_002214 [[Candida] californica]
MANVLLVGMGAVGSIAAYTLQRNGSVVSVVARSAYDILTNEGFNLESCDYGNILNYKPNFVFKSISDAMKSKGPFDYIVITTKNIPDIQPVENLIAPAFTKNTSIVLLENGIGIERSMFKTFPDSIVISGVTLIGTTLYGKIVKHFSQDIVSFGPFINPNIEKGLQIEKAKEFTKLYSNEKNKIEYNENVKYFRWRKLIFNGAVNTTCAITGVDSGRLDMFGGMHEVSVPAMKEIVEIAKADGVELPNDIINFMVRLDDGEYAPPSMLIDVRRNQYTEYKVLLGNALEIAREYGIKTPTCDILYHLCKVIQMRIMESHGKFVLPEKRPLIDENYQIQFKE